MLTFAEFKAGQPARLLFDKLGLLGFLESSDSWKTLRHQVAEFNDNPGPGGFSKPVRDCDAIASSGERVLLHAVCYACGFAWLADSLSVDTWGNGAVWQNMHRVNGDYLLAVIACIASWEE